MMRLQKLSLVFVMMLIAPSILIFEPVGDTVATSIPGQITTDVTYEDQILYQTEDVTITSTGILTLINTVLFMECTSSETFSITVNSGGKFIVKDDSKIEASDPLYEYNIEIKAGATFYADQSIFNNFGENGNGLKIQSNEVQITDCSISTNESIGFNIYDCSPSISDCTFDNIDGDAIRIEGACAPHLFNNEFIDNNRGIYLINNMDEYTGESWTDIKSHIEYNSESGYHSIAATDMCDAALLAAGTTVAYSGANEGIWGDGGDPEHYVEAALDGNPTDDYAMTNILETDNCISYFALDFNKEREIYSLKIIFESTSNYVTSFQIYALEEGPIINYDSSDWKFIVSGNPNTQDTWIYSPTPPIPFNAKYLLFKANGYHNGQNGPIQPMIRQFSAYLSTNEKIGIITSDPISLDEKEKWENLVIDRDIDVESDVLVSVCHQDRENGPIIPFEDLENLPYNTISLSSIDPIRYPEIILRFVLLNSGSTANNPKLYGFKISKSDNIVRGISWGDETDDIFEKNQVDFNDGEIHPHALGDCYSQTFDFLTIGSINNQDGWTVAGSGANCDVKVVNSEGYLSETSLKHEDLSTSYDLSSEKTLASITDDGAIEFAVNFEYISDNDFGYLLFINSNGGDNNGIRLRYSGIPSSISTWYGLNYLEYYSSSNYWERLGEKFQLNRSEWAYFKIDFDSDSTSPKFSVQINDMLIGENLVPYSLSGIDRIKTMSSISSQASSQVCYYLDEITVYEKSFEDDEGEEFVITTSMELIKGESINKIYFDFLSTSSDNSIFMSVITTDGTQFENSISGFLGGYSFIGATMETTKDDLFLIISFNINNPEYIIRLKRIWFEIDHIIADNTIDRGTSVNIEGMKIENADFQKIFDNTIANCSNGIKITNCIGTFNKNIIKTCSNYGLEVQDSEVSVNNIILDSNEINVHVDNSKVYLFSLDITYSSSGLEGFELDTNGELYLIDPDYTYNSNHYINNNGKIFLSHSLQIYVSDYPFDSWDEKRHVKVRTYYFSEATSTYTLLHFDYISDSGMIIVPEKVRQYSGSSEISTVITPTLLQFDVQNRFFITMLKSHSVSIVYGTDGDGDSIADIAELYQGKYLYELEDLVPEIRIKEDGAIPDSSGSISSWNVPLHEVVPSSPDYLEFSLVVRAKYYDGEADQTLSLSLWTGEEKETETFLMTDSYRWYQTDWYQLPEGYSNIPIEIKDYSGNQEVMVDKFILLYKENDENPPILGSSIMNDIDDDNLPDGYEKTPNGLYFEAEHYYIGSSYSIINDVSAENSKYINCNVAGEFFVQFDVEIHHSSTSSEDYSFYIRASNEEASLENIGEITIIQGAVVQHFTQINSEDFVWYKTDNCFTLINDVYTFKIKIATESGYSDSISIDRIIMLRQKDIEIKENIDSPFDYSQDPISIDVPTWGIAHRAYIEYTSESTKYNRFPSINHVQSIDTHGSLTVYCDNSNNLNAYDRKDNSQYTNLATGLNLDSAPSIFDGEIIYSLNNNNKDIYYLDIRDAHNQIPSPVLISNVGATSYGGLHPEIFDGTAVWKSSDNMKIFGRFLDSGHFINVPGTGSETAPITSYLSIYDRSVAYVINNNNIPLENKVRIAHLGIFADLQANKATEPGLSPYIQDIRIAPIEASIKYHQVSLYENQLAILIQDSSSEYKIELVDLTDLNPAQPNIVVSGVEIDPNSRILLYGDYLAWVEIDVQGEDEVKKIMVKEIGSNSIEIFQFSSSLESKFSLYGGILEYIIDPDNDNKIYEFIQDVHFKVINPDNTKSEFYKTEYFAQSPHTTYDFSDELNSALKLKRKDPTIYNENEGSYNCQLEITSNIAGMPQQAGPTIVIEVDSILDPFSADFDGDGLLDGDEYLNYYKSNYHETEDTIDFKEWLEPTISKSHDIWSNLAATYYKSSPMFGIKGADLITGTYEGDGNDISAFQTSSFIQFSLPETIDQISFQVEISPDPEKGKTLSDFEGFIPNGLFPNRMRRGTENQVFGELNSNIVQEEYILSSEERDYVEKVLNSIIYINYTGYSDEYLEIISETKSFNILYCMKGKYIESEEDYYNPDGDCDLFLAVNMTLVATINCGGSTHYEIEIRCDMDRLPDELNPDPTIKGELGEMSEVPEEFDIVSFNFIRLMDMDRIVISKKQLDPTLTDTDFDGLTDLEEIMYQTCPLSGDSDEDALSDYVEINTYGTNPNYRDTDGDSIRDGVELKLQNNPDIKTSGSWFERKARYDDYFNYDLISNNDADADSGTDPLNKDTDSDGLPDGWIDGWYYYGDLLGGQLGSYYSAQYWRNNFNHDNLIQVYEGEDLNFDGSTPSGDMSSFDFDGVTFEFAGGQVSETDPLTPNSDDDNVPDGYEVWYATREPFIYDVSETLLIDPTTNDGTKDKDTDDYIVINSMETGDTGYPLSLTTPRIAQEIYVEDSTEFKMVTRIAIKGSQNINSLEIWTGGVSNGPISLVYISGRPIEINENWRTFDIPQGYFYNGIESGFCFYIVISFTGAVTSWNYAYTQNDRATWKYEIGEEYGSWISFEGEVCYKLFIDDFTSCGDDIGNEIEYTVGTNPKNPNSDNNKWDDYNDKLTDGKEVSSYNGGTDGALARTNVPDGALKFSNIYGRSNSDDLLKFDEDPCSSGSDIYTYKHASEGTSYTYTSWTNKPAFQLRDGSLVTKVVEGSNIYLIVWDSLVIDFESYSQTKTIPFRYVRYLKDDQTPPESSLSIGVSYRGMDVYFSEPCTFDTDKDGIYDGDEIDWNLNSDDYVENSHEYIDLGTDVVYNVRDIDSDNDGVNDGNEPFWDEDFDGQGLDTDALKNMVDPDSDGDGVWDGGEIEFDIDSDSDGLMNCIDADSDNDGLCDGYKEGWIWDPNPSVESFVQYNSCTIWDPTNTPQFDGWEGEDRDCDGIIDTGDNSETNPTIADSDGDGLLDGYDIINNGVKRGELYEMNDNDFDTYMGLSGYEYNRYYIPNQQTSEQNENTDQLNGDDDVDGLLDGYEVNGWMITINRRYADTSGIHTDRKSKILSNPLLSDLDNDEMNDKEEEAHHTLPYKSDTDNDNLEDKIEVVNWETNPCDFDTDKDHLPDGWIDGWFRISLTGDEEDQWSVVTNKIDTNADYWEGEDISTESGSYGTQNGWETHPLNIDTDDDGIIDGFEYFYNNAGTIIDPTGIAPHTSNPYYDCDGDRSGSGPSAGPNARDIDSDGDGLDDNDEDLDHDGELDATYNTGNGETFIDGKEPNPYDQDTDNDNLEDGEDVMKNYELYYDIDVDNDGRINSCDMNSDGDSDTDDIDPAPLDNGISDGDQDGLLSNLETLYGSSDSDSDSDDDGVGDYAEVFVYKTDPMDTDTDDDGYSDNYEIQTSNTKPYLLDSDDDGLSDKIEYDNYANGLRPNNPDIDNDGLLDGNPFEGVKGFNGVVMSKSNWLNNDAEIEYLKGEPPLYNFQDADSDYDGLTDAFELHIRDSDGKQIGNPQKDEILGDVDNDLLIDVGSGGPPGRNGEIEYWQDTNPIEYDTDEDNIPDGFIDGWTIDAEGNWEINDYPNNVKERIEGECISFDGEIEYSDIFDNAVDLDFDGDGLSDDIELSALSDPREIDSDQDTIDDPYDFEPYYNLPIQFAFRIKQYWVGDYNIDGIFGNYHGGPDIYFKVDASSRENYLSDDWTKLELSNNKYPDESFRNDWVNSIGSSEIHDLLYSFITTNMPQNHHQIKFSIRMFDSDIGIDQKIGITPQDGDDLIILYDVISGQWCAPNDYDDEGLSGDWLKSGNYPLDGILALPKYDDTGKIIGIEKISSEDNRANDHKDWGSIGISNTITGDGMGYVTGLRQGEDGKDHEKGGIQFDIVPVFNTIMIGSDYYRADPDFDGLLTISERFWRYKYPSLSPLKFDSEDNVNEKWDGLPDGWEIRYHISCTGNNNMGYGCYNINPLYECDISDSDRDHILDINEYSLNSNPTFIIKKSLLNNVLEAKLIWIEVHVNSDHSDLINGCPTMEFYGAQPDRMDIFVELDWMDHYTEGWGDDFIHLWPHTHSCKPQEDDLDLIKYQFFISCKELITQLKMGPNFEIVEEEGKRIPYITMHIDDGCLGGGGTIVKQLKWVSKYEEVENELDINSNRKEIFIHGIIGDKLLKDDFGNSRNGIGGGGRFFIGLGNFGVDNHGRYRKIFIHEVGHTLLNMIWTEGSLHNHQSNYYDDYYFLDHCIHKCVMQGEHENSLDEKVFGEDEVRHFCNDCWREILYDGINEIYWYYFTNKNWLYYWYHPIIGENN